MELLTDYVAQHLAIPKEYTIFVTWGIRASVALLVLIVTAILARRKRIRRTIDWLDEKIGVIELTTADRSFFAMLFWSLFWLGGILVLLRVLRLTTLLATVGLSAGILTTIAALANRELIGNVFSGFVLQARRQIAPGDTIGVLNVTGELNTIGLTASTIVGVDGAHHHIPNTKMLNEKLTNYSQAQFRRATITFRYDPDECYPEDVEELLNRVIAETEGQSKEKTAFYRFGDFDEKGQEVKLYLYFEPQIWSQQASNARRLLVDLIDETEVQIGIPQLMHVQLEEPEEEPKKKKSSKK